MKKVLIFLISLVAFSCIGTDVLDDEIGQERITIDQDLINILINMTTTLSAEYINEFGVVSDADLSWLTDDPSVATIDNNGVLTAIAGGQTLVTVQAGGVISDPLLVTVVESSDDVAKVLIVAPKVGITINETVQFQSTAWNVGNQQIMNPENTVWSLNDPNIAEIDADGNLTGLSDGLVIVTATIEGVESEPLEVTVGTMQRVAQFESVNGYRATGTATLFRDDQGAVILDLSSDFSASFALGTFIYLSNTTSGGGTRSAGLDLGEIKSGGAKTFNVSSLEEDVELDTYRYVIVLCRPAGINFGQADFEK